MPSAFMANTHVTQYAMTASASTCTSTSNHAKPSRALRRRDSRMADLVRYHSEPVTSSTSPTRRSRSDGDTYSARRDVKNSYDVRKLPCAGVSTWKRSVDCMSVYALYTVKSTISARVHASIHVSLTSWPMMSAAAGPSAGRNAR
jgi:hypothetical protein